jgi:hypothetical protein
MAEGNGKAVGGAAVGVGGLAAMIMKLCSHEPGVAMTAARSVGEVGVLARGAGEVGAVAAAGRGAGEVGALAAAGRGAGEVGALGAAGRGAAEIGVLGHGAGALVSGERGAAQLVLAGVGAPVEVSNLAPVAAHAAEDGARLGASGHGIAPGAAKGTTAVKAAPIPAASKVARSSKLKFALEHAADAKDAVDIVLDGWNIYQDSLDKDVETELDRRLSPTGLSSSDVLPAVRGEPVDGLAGATRLLLSDGHALVPAARLAEDAASSLLGPADKHAIAQHQGTPLATIYLEVPSDDRVMRSTSLPTRLLVADLSPRLEWVELVTVGPVTLPTILEQGRRRFVRIAAGGTRVVLLRAK